MLRAYAVALSSLLSGAAAVHAVYQPDLVRWGGAARLRGRRRRTWQRGRGSLRGARAPCAPLCCAGAARGGGAQMCVVRYPCRAAGCGAERYRARAASQGKPRWPPFPPRRGQRVAPGACLALGDARRPVHSVSDVISSVSSWPRCSAAAAHAAQRGGDLATQAKKERASLSFSPFPEAPLRASGTFCARNRAGGLVQMRPTETPIRSPRCGRHRSDPLVEEQEAVPALLHAVATPRACCAR